MGARRWGVLPVGNSQLSSQASSIGSVDRQPLRMIPEDLTATLGVIGFQVVRDLD